MASVDCESRSIEVGSNGAADGVTLEPAKVALVLGLLGFLAFAPTLGNEFVAMDDITNLVKNRDFRGVGWPNIQWAWTTMLLGVYQPIAWMLLEIQYLFTGLNPYGYHLTSALLHALNTVVLFYLTLALIRRCRPDLEATGGSRLILATTFSVALFALHPMRTEVVAWVSAQPYLPSALFAMLSVLAYLRANPVGAPEGRSRWLVASFLLYAAAVLSKASAIPLPAVFLVLDVYPLRRLGGDRGWWNRRPRRVIAEKLPVFALCGAFMAAAVLARQLHAENFAEISGMDLSTRIAIACYSVMSYPLESLWPFGLNAFYYRSPRIDLFEPRFLLAIAGTIAATALIVRERRRHPGMLASWAIYLIMLAPVSGLIPTGVVISADRYSYLTMVAFAAPMAVMFSDLAARASRLRLSSRVQVAGAVVMLAPLVVLTYIQCRTRAIEEGEGDYVADLHNQLGVTWASKGHLDLAVLAFHEALRIKPHLQDAKNNLRKAIAALAERSGKPKPKV
jgi:hypothetical protein